MISTTSARSIRHGIYLGRGIVIREPGIIWQRLFERAFVRTRVRFARDRRRFNQNWVEQLREHGEQ